MTRSIVSDFLRSWAPRTVAVASALGLALALPVSAQAGGTKKYKLADFDDFDAGEVEGAAIESAGRVSVGFADEQVDLPGALAFSCLSRKNDVLVGTADKATIQRVFVPKAKRGKPAVPKVEVVAELDGVLVSAMTSLGGDTLAATLPGGKILRVTKKGKVSTFAELPVEQIWALAVHDGRVLAATGPKGELFSIAKSGKDPKVILDSEDKHLLSLFTLGDDVIVGTAPEAKLLQVSKDETKGLLLHDFPGDEVRAIGMTRTGLLAAVNEFADRKLSSLDALNKTLDRTSLVGQPPSGSNRGGSPPKADATLYHVDLGKGRDLARASEAPWESWLERKGQYFTSILALDDVGTVLVASSADGKVYRVRGPRTTATVADFEERQTTALCRADSGPIFAATGHAAAAHRLLATSAKSARYRSKVFAADQPAAYGALMLRGAAPLSVRARVGPSPEPDGRWTDWTDVSIRKDKAESFRGSLSALPRRRYLQLEVALERPDSELRHLELFYSPENLAPLLSKVNVQRPSFDADDNDEPSPRVTIKWDVDARDDDDLVYGIRVRPEGGGDRDWIRLHPGSERITKRELKWDLSTMPDGVYEIEVVASDEPSNGAGAAKRDGLVSDPFVVDRVRPELSDVKVAGRKVTAKATDATTYIHDAGFSVDGADFAPAAAADGIFDSPTEAVELEIPDSVEAGRHRLVVRARDAYGNIGTVALFVDL